MQGSTPMQDFIKLETTLYSLTNKCLKTCKKFIKVQFKIEDEGNFQNQYFNSRYDDDMAICLNKCTQDYASLHQFVRFKFVQDLDNVYQTNQKVYQDFYNES